MIERLDETIDRVASEMTDAPADPKLAAALRARLHEPSRARVGAARMLCVAAATIALAIVGWRFFNGSASAPVQGESVNAAASTAAPTDSAVVLSDTRPLVPPAPLASVAAADVVTSDQPIAPLVLMEELAVPPVNVAPLEVANLEIADLSGGSEFEEPR